MARLLLALTLLFALPSVASAAVPDPMVDGPHPVTSMTISPASPGTPGDPQEAKLGLVTIEEPQGSGNAPTGSAAGATVQVRGSLFYPSDTTAPAPLIVLVHGNHGACHTGSGINCTLFNRNDVGYNYLAQNLASWGYVVFSLDQDQLIQIQDGNYGKGMHMRRLLIAAALDGLYQANQPGGLPVTTDANVATRLVGKLDFDRIGLMGHSRGGDAVSSFIDYNASRPEPGRRYTIRGVIALAPVDYERRAPKGVVYDLEAGVCDGDVSNLQGTRMYSRSLHVDPADPFPRMQLLLHGANHDAFNSEWDADGEDSSTADPACGPSLTTNPTSIRLSRGAYSWNSTAGATANFFSPSPALMGDQEKAGLATMAEFFRRYVGGETPFEPYLTGELMGDGTTPLLPATACPTSASGTAMPCIDRLNASFYAPPSQRLDVINPDPDNPLTVSQLGTSLVGTGFADPYANSPGTVKPPATAQGFDWCNPEPDQFTPGQLSGVNSQLPTAVKPCPLPDKNGLGGQANGARESAPVNGSYQPQLTLAWTSPASLSTRIPAGDGDVTKFTTLSLSTSVNYFDARNPDRTGAGLTQPEAAAQNFAVTLTDAAGHSASMPAGALKYGLALQQSVGNITTRMHVILRDVRIPLSDYAAAGVDLTALRSIAFEFGGTGMPASGSIQLADVRFQEAAGGDPTYAESATADGPAKVSAQTVRANNAVAQSIIDATPRDTAPATPDIIWLAPDGSSSLAPTIASAVTNAVSGTAMPCSDTVAPTASLAHARTLHGRLALAGVAKDAGCKGVLAAVHVIVSKRVGSRCAVVTPGGRLGKPMSCATPVSLVARSTKAWSVKFAHRLPRGTYTVALQAIDRAGNRQAAKVVRTLHVR